MNSFFYDEISVLKTAFKNSDKSIEVIADAFGLDCYISELVKEQGEKSNKVFVCPIDFTKEADISADKFFDGKKHGAEFVFIEILDFEESFPEGISALAEGELKALSEFNGTFKIAEKVCSFESELKKYIENYNIKVLRYTNIYGPECCSTCNLNTVFSDFRKNSRIELYSDDYKKYISLSYISTVVSDLLSVINYGKNGNIYNGSNTVSTVAEVKNIMYKLFASDGITLKYIECSGVEEQSFALSCRKIHSFCKSELPSLEESISKTLSEDGMVFMREKIKNVYEGKINRIREEEKGILLEVDRICKKHNINYYLVGGSLLGAVRHNGFIPWDDDVDICMLREDFEKFRNVCPSELAPKYAYQSYRNEKCTHYIYDKIRLKGTYFSSEHSGKYDNMQNGIFLDIFVFDKTANSKLMQKMHIYMIVMLRRLINVRWTKEPVTGKFALISKLILPFICLIPFGVYHSLFEYILRFYEKSNKSRFVLDGIGLYIKKGALPLSWVTDNTPVNFEGLELPGVKDSNSYLSMWYGDNYMNPPIISKRMSGHSISRLDLGEYLLSAESEKEISLKGELYDK